MMKLPNDERHDCDRRSRSGLIVLNALLLAALGAITFAPQAGAQNRVRGSYTMVAGGAKGATSSIVYVADTTNHEMIAVMYEPSQRDMIGIGYRNLAADAVSLTRGAQSR